MKESSYKSYDDLPLFLNSATVAKVLGVSPSSGYELMHEPGFPVLRIGSRIGCFSSLVRLKHRLYFIGYFQKGIGFINIGIQITKIDFLHYVPPFRFTGD